MAKFKRGDVVQYIAPSDMSGYAYLNGSLGIITSDEPTKNGNHSRNDYDYWSISWIVYSEPNYYGGGWREDILHYICHIDDYLGETEG